MAKVTRNSNIELLRILSMFAIIAFHFSRQSGTVEYTLCVNDFLLSLIGNGGSIAVNVFLLIGVWYMVDSKFSAARNLKMYFQLYFYSSLLTIVALIIDYKAVSLKYLIYGFVPFIGRALWFASSYLWLLTFKPFLDLILQWEKKKLTVFTTLFFILMSLFSTILTTQDGSVVDTVWFGLIYLVIGTIKKYPPKLNKLKWKGIYSLILFAVGYTALAAIRFFVTVNKGDNIIFKALGRATHTYILDIKSFPNILLAGLIFHFFITMKPHASKLINSVSKSTFSVYIIHQVPAFFPIMWPTFFNTTAWLPAHNVLYVIFVVFAVFTVCSIIDIPRRKWLEPAFSKTKFFKFLTAKIEKVYN